MRKELIICLLIQASSALFSDVSVNTLSGSTGYKMVGTTSTDQFGGNFVSPLDFNGDGIADMVLGELGSSISNAGRTFVVFGQTGSSFTTRDMGAFTTSNSTGFRIIGVASSSTVGQPTGGVSGGDINGDGIDDLLVTTTGATNGLTYVMLGHTVAMRGFADVYLQSFSTGAYGYKILGHSASSYCGRNRAVGDVNSDGYDDIAVSCTGISTMFIIFNHAAPYTDVNLATFTQSASTGYKVTSINGPFWWLGGGGDFNNDGFVDVLVGNPYHDEPGRADCGAAYILFGHSSGTAFGNQDISTVAFGTEATKVIGSAASEYNAYFVTFAGDINGDGYDDITLGDVGADVLGRTYAGFATVIFGYYSATTYPTVDLASLASNRGFKMFGAAANAYGHGLGDVPYSGPGDINGDGYDDVLVASPFMNSDAGAAYVFYGHSTATSFADVDLASFTSGASGFRIFGNAASDNLGMYAIAFADVNGDGTDDIFISAYKASTLSRSLNGAVYVIYGVGPPTLSPTRAPTRVPTSQPSSHPSRQPSRQPSSQPSVHPSSRPSAQPSRQPSARPSAQPSSHPSAQPSVRPSTQPTTQPSSRPSTQPNAGPSAQPTTQPSGRPSTQPSSAPSSQPRGLPSVQPSSQPSTQPSSQPFLAPSAIPTAQPSSQPSTQPSTSPSSLPSSQPVLVPSAIPSSQPSSRPSTQPFAHPSAGPSSQPSSQPSTRPSTSPSSVPTSQPSVASMERRSRTYKVTNGYAFAVTSAAGSVHTWGEATRGGDSSAVQHGLLGDVTSVVASLDAFAAVKTDGKLVTWGDRLSVSRSVGAFGGTYSVRHLVANEVAFAGTDARTGRVLAFGSPRHGGDVQDDTHCSGCSQQLSAHVVKIAASAGAFAARKFDGSVFCWGNKFAGADMSASFLANITDAMLVRATRSAFAVLLRSGKVLAWGDKHAGGDASGVEAQLASNVTHIVGTRSVFVAFKTNTSIVVWGNKRWGGDMSAVAAELSVDVTFVAHTFTAIAALKADGSVVTWGAADGGGDSSAVRAQLQDVAMVVGNSKAFVALTGAGKVVAWGKAVYGGQIPSNKVSALSSGVVSIHHTNRAFAALKDVGSVVVWGQAGHGGSPGAAVEAHLVSGVHTICSNDAAFSVIKTDGSVVGWGHPVCIPTAGVLFTSSNLTDRAVCA